MMNLHVLQGTSKLLACNDGCFALFPRPPVAPYLCTVGATIGFLMSYLSKISGMIFESSIKLEQMQTLSQRQLLRRRNSQQYPRVRHFIRLRIDLEIRHMRVELHILLTNFPASFHRLDPLGDSVTLHNTVLNGKLRDEKHRIVRRSIGVRTMHASSIDRLHRWNGSICITHLRPRHLSTLQNEFRADTELARQVENQISQLAWLDRPNQMRTTMNKTRPYSG